MTKGSYAVGENNTPPRKDTSYRSFICVLLIFLVICLIILLASIQWGSGRSQPELEHDGHILAQTGEDEIEVIHKDRAKPNRTHEKIQNYDKFATEAGSSKEEETTTLNKWKVDTTNEYERKEERTDSEEKEFAKYFGEDNASTTEMEKLTSGKINKEQETTTIGGEEYTKFFDKAVEEFTSVEIDKEPETTTLGGEESTKFFDEVKVGTTAMEELTSVTEQEATTSVTEASTGFERQELIFPTYISNDTDVSTEDDVSTTETDELTSVKIQKQEETTSFSDDTTTNVAEEELMFSTYITNDTETTTDDSAISLSDATTTNTIDEVENLTINSTTSTTVQKPQLTTTTTEASVMESDADDAILPETSTDPSTWSTLLRHSLPLTKTEDPVCRSDVCKATASQMIGKMKHSIEPCVDFYEFACGQAIDTKDEIFDVDMLENQLHLINGSSVKYAQDFKRFYESCLKYDNYYDYHKRMNGLEALLEEVGQFALNSSSTTGDITDLLTSLILRQSMPLFDIGIDVDKTSADFILQLTIPYQSFLRTGLEKWSGLYLLKEQCLQQQKSQLYKFTIDLNEIQDSYQQCQQDYSTYLNSVESVIRDLKAFQSLDPQTLFAKIKEVRMTIEFDVLNNLIELPSPAEIVEAFVNKNYEVRRISDLQFHYPVVEWKKLFESITGHRVDENTKVQVYFPNYLKTMFWSFAKSDKIKLNNALLSIYAYDLFINTVIAREESKRNDFCADLSKKLLPDVFSHFIAKYYPVEEQNNQNIAVKDMFDKLKKNFCNSLYEAKWIDDNTKISIMGKCNGLNLTFYTPPDHNTLIKSFESVNVTDDYQTNLIHLLEKFKRRIYSLEGTSLSSEKIYTYFLDPSRSKPLTFYASPIIAAPLGLVKKVTNSIPNYLQLARVGFPLARQLVRHFDPTGIKYGITLTSTSLSSFKEFTYTMETLMDDSSPRIFHNKNLTFELRGNLSMNDRIVDSAAIRLVFDSLNFVPVKDLLPWISADYSREKIFFIATAQGFCKKTTLLDFMLQVFEERHLPPVLRVRSIVGSSERFSEYFACADGSDMYLSMKIQFPFLNVVTDYEDYDFQENK